MRARVVEEHGVAGGVEKTRALDHVEAAAPDPVEEEDDARPAPAGHEPSPERAGRGAQESHGSPRQVAGELADLAWRGRGQRPRRPVAGARTRKQEQRGEGAEASDYFTSPA
jgi:hypothetical protein